MIYEKSKLSTGTLVLSCDVVFFFNLFPSREQDPRIGDLMKKNAPFLKMYTEYIRNFDNAMKLINQWMEKSSRFSEIIQDIQVCLCGSQSDSFTGFVTSDLVTD